MTNDRLSALMLMVAEAKLVKSFDLGALVTDFALKVPGRSGLIG